MIIDFDVPATCRLLVERYHRAFDEELPRLENLGWKIAHAHDVAAPFARALMQALLSLKDEVLRHTAVAEATVHPFAGTADGDVLLDEHLADQASIHRMVTEAKKVAAGGPHNRVSFALADGLETLDRNLERFFALERTLKTGARGSSSSSVSSSSVSSVSSVSSSSVSSSSVSVSSSSPPPLPIRPTAILSGTTSSPSAR